MNFTADFETTTDVKDCRVWATGICAINDDYNFEYGNNIDFFFHHAFLHPGSAYYFHNLKFDGEFILYWLFKHGYKHTLKTKLTEDKLFSTLISKQGAFYCLRFSFEINNKIETILIIDSLKILPFSVNEVAKAFNLPLYKLELDYNTYRPIGYKLNEHDIEYLKHDVVIMARGLHILFREGLTKMTQGSNAFNDYKNIIGKKKFARYFPIPAYDFDIRQSYKGGFTYCNPKFANKNICEGIVLDVNSLYPSVMYECMLPYGEGIYFDGEYKQDKLYNLYVIMFTCQFELKDGYIPTIQLKNTLGFIPTEYVTSSNGEDITLCLTSVDLQLFLEHYNVYNLTYHGGWKFKSTNKLFKDYIDKWMKIKEEATVIGNKAMRTLAKLMLNALYGKFALNPNVQCKIPFLDSNDVVKYAPGPEETRNPIYIPVGTFITAWARYKTITSAQKLYDRFIYADTDSLHLVGTEIPKELEIHPTKLGAWKHESTFTRARFLRAKTYIEEIEGELHITCAGMPKQCYENVTWDNFLKGSSFSGKLIPNHVKGGIVLTDTPFTIK